jgi:molybdopterin-guanine dinucleotide biosynthesis protein A
MFDLGAGTRQAMDLSLGPSMSHLQESVSLAVLAGGHSRRMGTDKGLARLAGRPLIEHVLERVGHLSSDCLIATNRPDAYNYLGHRVAPDDPERAGAGTLTGLETALSAAQRSTVLVVGCDMPFISPALAKHLLELALDPAAGKIVVGESERGLEPLLGVYPTAALASIRDLIERGSQRLNDLLDIVPIWVVERPGCVRMDPEELSYFNVNTPEELSRAEALLQRLTGSGPE